MCDTEQATPGGRSAILLGTLRLGRCASESFHPSLVEDHSWALTLQHFWITHMTNLASVARENGLAARSRKTLAYMGTDSETPKISQRDMGINSFTTIEIFVCLCICFN